MLRVFLDFFMSMPTFFFSKFTFQECRLFFQKYFSGKLSDCQTTWIQNNDLGPNCLQKSSADDNNISHSRAEFINQIRPNILYTTSYNFTTLSFQEKDGHLQIQYSPFKTLCLRSIGTTAFSVNHVIKGHRYFQ